jgi:hypothetical protein
MTLLILHAVARRDDLPELGDRMRALAEGDVAVVYEETAESPDGGRDAVAAYGHTILALAEQAPLLPMRYGTAVRDLDELRQIVREHADSWDRRIQALSGRCELVVHLTVSDEPDDAGAAATGRDYLLRRVEVQRRRSEAVERVARRLAPWAEDVRVLPGSERIAALVRKSDAATVRRQLLEWAGRQRELSLIVAGPWPAFSFCEETRPDDDA